MRKRMEVGSTEWSVTADIRDCYEPHERPAAQRRFNAHRYLPYGLLPNRERPKRLQNTAAARRQRRSSPQAGRSSSGRSASSARGDSGAPAGGGGGGGGGDDPPPPTLAVPALVDGLAPLAGDPFLRAA